jgi:HD-GYP domain-containing protein (c-di-GMP phosphodiesterase class II)
MYMNKKTNVLNFQKAQTSSISIMSLMKNIDDLKDENQRIQEAAAKTILKALDFKDHYTFGHSMRVCYFSLVLGRELKLTDEQLNELELSAIFHDIGKIGTPDAILNKPTRLTEEEFKIMKEHPVNSYNILKELDGFEKIAINTKHHHERYDGRGYPDQLKGDQIPLVARIILIADTFDAMTSTRPYRKGLAYQVAYDELNQFSGTQFDPELVKLFIKGMMKEEKKQEKTFYIPLMGKDFLKDAA